MNYGGVGRILGPLCFLNQGYHEKMHEVCCLFALNLHDIEILKLYLMNVEGFTGRGSEMLLQEKPAAGNARDNICFGKEVRPGQAVILKSPSQP